MKLFNANFVRYTVCLGLVLLWSLPKVYAQVSSAQVTGLVTDTSGAVLPGASVLIVNQGTGASRHTETNQSGDFVVPALEPGSYRIAIEATGFKKMVADNVTLNVGDKKSLNFSLTVGAAQQTVTVTSSGALINATSAEISTVINEN